MQVIQGGLFCIYYPFNTLQTFKNVCSRPSVFPVCSGQEPKAQWGEKKKKQQVIHWVQLHVGMNDKAMCLSSELYSIRQAKLQKTSFIKDHFTKGAIIY